MRLTLLLSLFVLAINTANAIPIETTDIKFDIKNANQQFDRINLKLSVQNLDRGDLDKAVATLTELDRKAAHCVTEAEKKLSDLNDLVTQSNEQTSLDTRGVDNVYINHQKKELAAQQAECRLFSIRAQEAIVTYRAAASQLLKKEAMVRETPLWTAISKVAHDCYQNQCVLPFNLFQEPSLTLPLLTLLLGYGLFLLLIHFGFKTRIIRAYCLWNSLDRHFFHHLAIVALSLGAIGLVGDLLSMVISANSDALWQIFGAFYLFTVLGVSFYFIHYFCDAHPHYSWIGHYRKLILLMTLLWILVCVITDITGYHHLATHIVLSGLSSMAIVFITLLLTLGVQHLYTSLYSQPTLQEWMSYYFGYRSDQLFWEFFIFKITLQMLIIALGIYWIGESLDFATYAIESLYFELLNGVRIVSIMVYPSQMISGVIAFCLLFLIFRSISRLIIRRNQHDGEEETQVALASIATYAGFTFSLITGLMIAGFNFTGLAIVAGALSVGIGLGLQSIVNNFVSGLILLIEKPIRPGDRISVDGVEGFVKKIRVRSTQILTPSREDIIIPNSDLITRRVTIYMFSDKNSRICCDIGVAYGSDTHLVRDTLLNIANLHEDVVKTGRFKPLVLFRSFGESTLSFQLWCLIKDVNKKLVVQSDLNYAIDEAFQKQNISMAFPQRELHIHWPKESLLRKFV